MPLRPLPGEYPRTAARPRRVRPPIAPRTTTARTTTGRRCSGASCGRSWRVAPSSLSRCWCVSLRLSTDVRASRLRRLRERRASRNEPGRASPDAPRRPRGPRDLPLPARLRETSPPRAPLPTPRARADRLFRLPRVRACVDNDRRRRSSATRGTAWRPLVHAAVVAELHHAQARGELVRGRLGNPVPSTAPPPAARRRLLPGAGGRHAVQDSRDPRCGPRHAAGDEPRARGRAHAIQVGEYVRVPRKKRAADAEASRRKRRHLKRSFSAKRSRDVAARARVRHLRVRVSYGI